MSGHSKWSTIKRKKGAIDAKRSKIFSRIVKEIMIAVKEGGNSDPESNPRLRVCIANAKSVNMPKDNIARAISKAEKDTSSFAEMTFEGYGPGGVAIFVDCLTDNNLRTVGAIRAIFKKREGTLGTNGSLAFIFERKGIFTILKGENDMEELELELIDAGLEDIEAADDKFILTTSMEDFGNMQKKLEELSKELESAELERIPNNMKSVNVSTALINMKIIDGNIFVGDVSVAEIADKYGTPTYVYDEQRIRENYRRALSAFTEYYPDFRFFYAVKACNNPLYFE